MSEFEVAVQNAEGREVDRVTFSAERFDSHQRSKLLKEAIVMYQANRRSGTHDTKTRSEITGSNHKPWRQKGTGRARAGSRKSPLWRGGGTIFGPHPRDYSYRINKKQRRLALRSALFTKFRGGGVKVVEGLEVAVPRTRDLARILKNLGIKDRVLIGIESLDRNLWLSARNITGVTLLPVKDFNALEVLHAGTVLLTRAALTALLEGGQGGDSGVAAVAGKAPAEAPAEDRVAGGEGGAGQDSGASAAQTEGGS